MRITVASLEDLDQIVALERYCFPPEIALGRTRWRYLLGKASGYTLLIRAENQQLMGYLAVLTHKRWQRLLIHAIAIRWTIRRQGWAVHLLQQAIAQGQDEGWRSVRLEVAESNEAAIALYHRLGFRPQRWLPHYYGRDRHGWRMVLPLLAGESE